jgi:hypothetical protein
MKNREGSGSNKNSKGGKQGAGCGGGGLSGGGLGSADKKNSKGGKQGAGARCPGEASHNDVCSYCGKKALRPGSVI